MARVFQEEQFEIFNLMNFRTHMPKCNCVVQCFMYARIDFFYMYINVLCLFSDFLTCCSLVYSNHYAPVCVFPEILNLESIRKDVEFAWKAPLAFI